MNVGVTVRLDQPITEAARWAQRAEDLGFSSVWLADHYFHRDVAAALALMMTATRRVRLGTAVVSPFLRHPTLLASLAATLREIGPDRFVLGLGAGGYEFAGEMGISMRRPLQLTREAVDIIRQLTAGTADVRGETFSADGSALRWPAQDGPLYLAARGPKMLELAGSCADGVITHGISDGHITFVQERVAAGAADRASGRAEVCLMLDVEIGDDRAAALRALAPRCVTMAGGAYADELIEVYGLDRDEVAALRTTVRSGDRALAASQVTPAMAEAFGLAGAADEVADGLRRLADRGVDEVIVSVGGSDPAAVDRQLSALAQEVFA
ncbi:5,10-methylenetetrahydromethanopterin reductase [Beutenbergia cavernae DSM 12333]|uniref:5,10-methylenetetrahydromethanopterin reductase n=1 Tax=Beutenbergia cavernae (strain ATCC BAA-8 / DSM 12333 / CCUG 43141 / JCM 11478 / NBRC 16432 / NCIMB 13614 / HKI 0122) TaxID=471853 RepID=C5C420_BEUC1|nr:LLM class flavin-dependent oxidoreductase [Beutenbergia cavernae]ACQ79933.1 5,10-methylenetetrahydromethanopterin reductase [Beutenbergia cavernae DSM 12333]